MRYYSRKEIREALKAHNSGKEMACYNENYNESNHLGTQRARSLINEVIYHKHGLVHDSRVRVTMRDVDDYARNCVNENIRIE